MKTGTECLLKTMETVDTILLGRSTYEILSKGWPQMNDSELGKKINSSHKLLVTRNEALTEASWGGYEAAKIVTGDNMEEQIQSLKNTEGGNIIIFGSPTLVRSLADANLIDEYQMQVHPVVLNVGEHLFDALNERMDFTLIGAQPLTDGSIFVRYKPANPEITE